MGHNDILIGKRCLCLLFLVFCTMLYQINCRTVCSDFIKYRRVFATCIHGNCSTIAGHLICKCREGWSGTDCGNCCQKKCRGGSQCLVYHGTEICQCLSGKTDKCTEIPDTECTTTVCSDIKCKNGGICKLHPLCYAECICPAGYGGDKCEKLENKKNFCPHLCHKNTCKPDEQCFIRGEKILCKKMLKPSESYTRNMMKCVHGSCKSKEGEFWCQCQRNWGGNDCNTTCEKNCNTGECVIIDKKETCLCPDTSSVEPNCTNKLAIGPIETGICYKTDCKSEDMNCWNGGTCILNEPYCEYECKCLPDFIGRHCEFPKALHHECPNTCSGTCHPFEICSIDRATLDIYCYQRADLHKRRRVVQVRCLHGQCKRRETGEFTCQCDDQMAGLECDIPCEKVCTSGQCVIVRGNETCKCLGPFTLESNCTEKMEAPINVDTEYRKCKSNCTSIEKKCLNGGTCRQNKQCSLWCECFPGFKGFQCQISRFRSQNCPVNCRDHPCYPNEVCSMNPKTFRIRCKNIYTGLFRPVIPVDCLIGQCEISKAFEFTCKCEEGYADYSCRSPCPKNCTNPVCIKAGQCAYPKDLIRLCPSSCSGVCHIYERCSIDSDIRIITCTDIRHLEEFRHVHQVWCLHGQCRKQATQYICQCDKGWANEKCDAPCLKNCNNGICILVEQEERCKCEGDYTPETNCKTLYCHKQVCRYRCKNGGTCKLNVWCLPECECRGQFIGSQCEIRKERSKQCPNSCSQVCQSNQTCKIYRDYINCFHKKSTNDIDRVSTIYCVHGQCVQLKPREFICQCKNHWRGTACDIPCTKNCNDGECIIHKGKETCNCFEKDHTPESNCTQHGNCRKNICRHETTCLNGADCRLDRFCKFSCVCEVGFTGRRCEIQLQKSDDCPNWCMPGVCKPSERCHVDKVNQKISCTQRNNTNIKRPIIPIRCYAGECKVSEDGEIWCQCKYKVVGKNCGLACTKTCTHGQCSVIRGFEECRCLGSDYKGEQCERLEKLFYQCPKRCRPDPCKKHEQCIFDKATNNMSCVINKSSRPVNWIKCVYGGCEMKRGKSLCKCHDTWVGKACDISCLKNCHYGKCIIQGGKEACVCSSPKYKRFNNCARCDLDCNHGKCVIKNQKQRCTCERKYKGKDCKLRKGRRR